MSWKTSLDKGARKMTDLTRGMFEICGLPVERDMLPTDIEGNPVKSFANKAVSKNGQVAIYSFHNVEIQGQCFDVDLTFIRHKLSEVELYSHYEDISRYEDRFKADKEWLKGILGEPTETGTHGIIYKFETVSIGASWQESDGRSGPDGCISITY